MEELLNAGADPEIRDDKGKEVIVTKSLDKGKVEDIHYAVCPSLELVRQWWT